MMDAIVKILSVVAWPIVWLIDRIVNKGKTPNGKTAEKTKNTQPETETKKGG